MCQSHKGAPHEPERGRLARVFGGLGIARARRPRSWFMVPMHAQERKGVLQEFPRRLRARARVCQNAKLAIGKRRRSVFHFGRNETRKAIP